MNIGKKRRFRTYVVGHGLQMLAHFSDGHWTLLVQHLEHQIDDGLLCHLLDCQSERDNPKLR